MRWILAKLEKISENFGSKILFELEVVKGLGERYTPVMPRNKQYAKKNKALKFADQMSNCILAWGIPLTAGMIEDIEGASLPISPII